MSKDNTQFKYNGNIYEVNRRSLLKTTGVVLVAGSATGAYTYRRLSDSGQASFALGDVGFAIDETNIEAQDGRVTDILLDSGEDGFFEFEWEGFNQEETDIAVKLDVRGSEDDFDGDSTEFEEIGDGEYTVEGLSGSEEDIGWDDVFDELPISIFEHDDLEQDDFSAGPGEEQETDIVFRIRALPDDELDDEIESEVEAESTVTVTNLESDITIDIQGELKIESDTEVENDE